MNWKGCGRKRCSSTSRYSSGIFLAGLRKTMKVASQHIPFPHGELNPGPCKYEAGVIATLQRRRVQLLKCLCSNGAPPPPPASAPVERQTFRTVSPPPMMHTATAPLTNIVPRDGFRTEMKVLPGAVAEVKSEPAMIPRVAGAWHLLSFVSLVLQTYNGYTSK
jgi:hypothetical protein